MLADPSLRFSKRRATGNARNDGRYSTLAKRRSNGNKGWRLTIFLSLSAMAFILLAGALTIISLQIRIPMQ
jgi:hypothetical protein